MADFAITVDFLTGRYVAASHFDRDQPEWPPHPARLFSALVAEHHAVNEPDPDERTALEWLERLPAPAISASAHDARPSQTHYVPVNDSSVLGLSLTERQYKKLAKAQDRLAAATTDARAKSAHKALDKALDVDKQVSKVGRTNPDSATELLPDGRGRQARTYPSVTPTNPCVSFIWQDVRAPSDRVVKALGALLSRVTRLGHSSSLVWVRIDDRPGRPTWVPDIDGDHDIRTTGAGQLKALERRFAVHQGLSPRSLPSISTAYRHGEQQLPVPQAASVFADGDWFVFAHDSGPHLHSTKQGSLAAAVRGALMSSLQHNIPALLSGHDSDGSPVESPHVAVVPLPFVGAEFATGLTMGFAIVVPPATATDLHDGRPRLLEAIAAWEARRSDGTVPVHLKGGREILFRRTTAPHLWSLRRSRWAGPAREWLSATPIALGRHPGSLTKGSQRKRAQAWAEAKDTVRRACGHVGLPQPAEVDIMLAPPLTGGRPPGAYLPHRAGNLRRAAVHARVVFDQPVQGPVVLGAGRYYGHGLMTPATKART